MKLPGRKIRWAFQDKEMRRLLKKKELRAEEKQWRDEVEMICCVQECSFPDCDCEDLDEDSSHMLS